LPDSVESKDSGKTPPGANDLLRSRRRFLAKLILIVIAGFLFLCGGPLLFLRINGSRLDREVDEDIATHLKIGSDLSCLDWTLKNRGISDHSFVDQYIPTSKPRPAMPENPKLQVYIDGHTIRNQFGLFIVKDLGNFRD